MATCDEIEEALACMQCCDALETHLEYCQPNECGVFETYWRTRYRVEAGECDDWLAPGRTAMVVMMTAEPWMHEHHDHRIVHDNKAITLSATYQPPKPPPASVASSTAEAWAEESCPPLTYERMAGLARDRLRRLKAARGTPTTKTAAVTAAVEVEQPEPPLWWEIHGPSGLVELHAELTVREVLSRGEHLAKIDADPEAVEWEALREHNVDELQAARTLLWTASDWLEVDDVLDLVAAAAHRMGWSHLRARDLFSELVGNDGEPER